MSDVKKIATRENYGKTLVELGAEIPNLVILDADLAGATKTGESGSAGELLHKYMLDGEGVYKQVKAFVEGNYTKIIRRSSALQAKGLYPEKQFLG